MIILDDPTEVELNMIDKLKNWGLLLIMIHINNLNLELWLLRKAVSNPKAKDRRNCFRQNARTWIYYSTRI